MENRKRNGDKRNIEPSSKVKRCLFGKPDEKERDVESEILKEETQRQQEAMKLKYNFDFENEKPLQLPNARFTEWERVESSDNNQSDVSVGGQSHGTSTTTQSHAEIERQLDISFDGTGANGRTSSNDESNNIARKEDDSTEEDARLS